MKMLHYSLLAFFRRKNTGRVYLFFFALIFAYLGYCFNNYLRFGEIYSTLVWLVRPCIFVVAFFIYCGYELAVQLNDNYMIEYLATYRNGLYKAYGAFILTGIIITAPVFILIFTFVIFLYRYFGIQYTSFLIHTIKLAVLYYGISPVIGVMLGTAMAAKLKTNRLAVYSLTVILVLLNTTYTDAPFRIPYLLFNSYFIERLLYYFKDFFTLVPHQLGSQFAVYPIYGFPMEPIRWYMAGFWFLFSLSLIMSVCSYRRIKYLMQVVTVGIIFIGIGLFSFRGSTLLMDMRVDSFPYADPFYYMERSLDDGISREAAFSIDEYDMSLTISNELHAEVTVSLNTDQLDQCDFTLYHGYILTSVSTESGPIPFIREGDAIIIRDIKGNKKLTFQYHGKSPKYYANKQGITLPGYFAYYPKAGRLPIWDKDRYGYVINVPQEISEYTVVVKSSLPIFTNLEGDGNILHGRTNGLSLFAGMYEEVDEHIYAEPLANSIPNRLAILEAEQVLSDIFRFLNHSELYVSLQDKKVFQVPYSFVLNSNTEQLVIMDDHITGDYFSDAQSIVRNYMMAIMKSKNWLRSDYTGYLSGRFFKDNGSDPEMPNKVDIDQVLVSINELHDLTAKYQDMTREKYLDMDDAEKQMYSTDLRRISDLEPIINEEAFRYLFVESPRQEVHLRVFFDYFYSGSEEDCYELIEKQLREEQIDDGTGQSK
jgi:hypothetical protein